MNDIQEKPDDNRWPTASIGEYFDAIGKFRLLTHEEETDLGRRISEDEQAITGMLLKSGLVAPQILDARKPSKTYSDNIDNSKAIPTADEPVIDRDERLRGLKQLKLYAEIARNARTEIERCETIPLYPQYIPYPNRYLGIRIFPGFDA